MNPVPHPMPQPRGHAYDPGRVAALLPHAQPASAPARLLLFATRRIASGGLDDAQAASALLTAFGLGFRRPLVLLRALLAEVSRVARRPLVLAPCCCARMTADEAGLLDAIGDAIGDARGVHLRLTALLAAPDCLGALTSAQAVAGAFADLGRPLPSGGQADQ